jgi:hypothetical protein
VIAEVVDIAVAQNARDHLRRIGQPNPEHGTADHDVDEEVQTGHAARVPVQGSRCNIRPAHLTGSLA